MLSTPSNPDDNTTNDDPPNYPSSLHPNVRQESNTTVVGTAAAPNDPNPFLLAIHGVITGSEADHQLALRNNHHSEPIMPSKLDRDTAAVTAAAAEAVAAGNVASASSSLQQHLNSTTAAVPNPLHPLHSRDTATNADTPLLVGSIPSVNPDEVPIGQSPVPVPPNSTMEGGRKNHLIAPGPTTLPLPTQPLSINTPHNLPPVTTNPVPRRGLAYAQHVRNAARAEFKVRRRRELEAAGETERVTRRRRNDTSLSKRGKYLRRLQKNQDSAAAARFSSDAYINCLEQQAEQYDPQVRKLEAQLHAIKAQRDSQVALHAQIISHHARLLDAVRTLREAAAENPPSLPQDPENELGFVRMPNAG